MRLKKLEVLKEHWDHRFVLPEPGTIDPQSSGCSSDGFPHLAQASLFWGAFMQGRRGLMHGAAAVRRSR